MGPLPLLARLDDAVGGVEVGQAAGLDDIGGYALAQHGHALVAHAHGDLAQRVLALGDGAQLVALQLAFEACDLVHGMEARFDRAIAAVRAGDDIRAPLQADGGAYEADIKAHYRLGREDDWTLDLIESNSIELVRTGKYGNCITSRRTGWFGEYEVEFINSCDAPLAVGGMVKYEYKDGWKKFCVIVDGNSSKRIGGLFWGSIADYKIEFVERP